MHASTRLQAVRHRLGLVLRALRRRRGLTQDQLAERAGLSAKFLGEIERGEANPALDSVVRLADALETDIAVLFAGTPEEPPQAVYISPERLEVLREALQYVNDLTAGTQLYGGGDEGTSEGGSPYSKE